MNLDKLTRKALSLGMAFLNEVLLKAVNKAWDDIWAKLFELVSEAEEKWDQSGQGHEKKSWVVNQLLAWLTDMTPINGFTKLLVRFVVGIFVDALIAQLNLVLGNDWVKKAQQVESQLADLVPFIDDEESA